MPDRLIEAVIALSIAFVARRTSSSPTVSRRWLVSFRLRPRPRLRVLVGAPRARLPAHGLSLSLFGFNVGVEVGQALVVGLSCPSSPGCAGRDGDRAGTVQTASGAVALLGFLWLVERVFHA